MLSVLCVCPSRILTSVLVGTACGVLGITGWPGFVVYIAAHILVG